MGQHESAMVARSKNARHHVWDNDEWVPVIFDIFVELSVHILELCFTETSLLQLVSLDMFDFSIQMSELYVNQRQ